MRTRVHLLKSEEVDQAAYHEILQQLQSFSGPLEFVSTIDEPVFEDDESTSFETYLKHIENTDGLYEIRVQIGSDIFRIFCFFDQGQLVVIVNGFQKKTQKTPKNKTTTKTTK